MDEMSNNEKNLDRKNIKWKKRQQGHKRNKRKNIEFICILESTDTY